jgi:cation diffusion facilitator family transporter
VQEGSRRAILVALIANLAIAAAKFVGFAFTGAASMLAEAIHSVADSGNQALLILGGRRALLPATPEHPFGYGRERYFWAFVVAVVLFTLGALFSLYEGISKLRHPHELRSLEWAVGILILAMIFEGSAFRTALREAQRLRRGQSWLEFVRRSKAPEIPVILLEDLGALVGLILALLCIGLATLTGNSTWDALGSIAIGVLLGSIAVLLGVEMKSLLIGESAALGTEQAIRETIESHAGIHGLIHLRTQHLGPEELLVAAKVAMAPEISLADAAAIIDEVEARVRERTPSARLIYLEPDVRRPGAAGAGKLAT